MRKRSWATLLLAAVVGVAAVAALVAPRGPPEFVWTDGQVIAEEPGGAPIDGWARIDTIPPEKVEIRYGPHGVEVRDHPSRVSGLPSLEGLIEVAPTHSAVVDGFWRAWPFNFPSRANSVFRYEEIADEMTAVDAADFVWTRCARVPETDEE